MNRLQLMGYLSDLEMEVKELRDRKETWLICTEILAEINGIRQKLRRARA